MPSHVYGQQPLLTLSRRSSYGGTDLMFVLQPIHAWRSKLQMQGLTLMVVQGHLPLKHVILQPDVN